MILLTGANNETYRHLMRDQAEFYGWLMQPRSYYRNQLASDQRIRWAMDNDAFKGFDGKRFLVALEYMMPHASRCLFVVCPDVVGDHHATIQLWRQWGKLISGYGFPVAFVAQDGCTVDGIPWNEAKALFIGGSDQFKDRESQPVIYEAKQRGIWVHVGRVNTPRRWQFCAELGVDSFDGTTFGIAPTQSLKKYQRWFSTYQMQRRLL